MATKNRRPRYTGESAVDGKDILGYLDAPGGKGYRVVWFATRLNMGGCSPLAWGEARLPGLSEQAAQAIMRDLGCHEAVVAEYGQRFAERLLGPMCCQRWQMSRCDVRALLVEVLADADQRFMGDRNKLIREANEKGEA